MKQVTFWFDVIPPYAYLAFERLPRALDGLSVTTHDRPVLFAGLLGQWGQVDSVDMLVACLHGDPWFDGPGWQASRTAVAGVVRRPPVLP